jgi:hypothetical protein
MNFFCNHEPEIVGGHVNISSVVEQIMYISWFWLVGREKLIDNVTFSDWCKNPLV